MPTPDRSAFPRHAFIVPAKQYDAYAEALAQAFSSLKVGDPMEPDTVIGPLVTAKQRDRVESLVESARAEGATVATGGKRPADLSEGWYYEPTLITNAHNDMKIAREEVFGPVVVLIPHEGEEDAIRIANDSPYGLSGSVFTADVAHGFRGGTSRADRDLLGQHRRHRPRFSLRWVWKVRHRSRARSDGRGRVPPQPHNLDGPGRRDA